MTREGTRRLRTGPIRKVSQGGVFSRLLRWIRESWFSLLEMETVWIPLFLILGTWLLLPRGSFFAPDVAEGEIAYRDFVASRELLVPDQETTQEKRDRAVAEVLPVYDFDPAVGERLDGSFRALFDRGRGILEADATAEGKAPARQGREEAEERESPWDSLPGEAGLQIGAEQMAWLVSTGFAVDLEDRITSLASRVLRLAVVSNKALLLEHREVGITARDLKTGAERRLLNLYECLEYPEGVRDLLAAEVASWEGLSRAQENGLVELILGNLVPNLRLNQSETGARRETAAASIEQVYTRVGKGQVIARTGDQITATQARVIEHLGGDRRLRVQLLNALGLLLSLALVVLALWLGQSPGKGRRGGRQLSELLLLFLVSLALTRLGFILAGALSQAFHATPFNQMASYLGAVPLASVALVAALFYGRQTAVLLSLLFVFYPGFLMGEELQWLTLYAVAGSLAVIFTMEFSQLKDRTILIRAGLMVGLMNMGMVLLMLALDGGTSKGPSQLGFDLLCGLVGGVLVAATVSFAVPILESVLSLTTGLKMVELGNTNLPLLRRLAFDAPGTFHHSLLVANLAKAGCEAIGADSVLAYTSALYHDIGKTIRPEYFIENQRSGENRHDRLRPSMSALVLISHVKEGLELARDSNLPQPILDAICQHHGTRLMKFFFSRAQEGGKEVSEEKFRYPGPRPQSKEMGVLMLADAAEAASRSLQDPSAQRLRAVIQTLTEDCLKDGQLDDTDLTLSDLARAGDAMERVLANMFHRRVDYPGFDFNAGGRSPRPREENAAIQAV